MKEEIVLLTGLPTLTNVEESWNEMKDTIHKASSATFDDQTLANWQIYEFANCEAKKAVAVIRADHYKNLYDKLVTRDGEKDLYRLAKSRNERTQDIEHFCCVNDKNRTLLTNRRASTDRWREYLEQISTEEFVQPPLPQSFPTFGSVGGAATLWAELRTSIVVVPGDAVLTLSCLP